MNVSPVLKQEHNGAKCAHRHGVICVISCGTSILQGEIIVVRYTFLEIIINLFKCHWIIMTTALCTSNAGKSNICKITVISYVYVH